MPTDIPTPPNAPGPTLPQPDQQKTVLPETSQASAPVAGNFKETNIGGAVAEYNEKQKIEKSKINISGIPSGLAPRWEFIVNEAAKRIKEKRDTIKIAIGDKPYLGIPVTEEDAKIRYLKIRLDSKLQTQALEENVTMSKAGKLLINKKYLEAIKNMEQKIRKGESN